MKKKKLFSAAGTGIFTILGIVYIMPILIVLMNSFKKKVYINKEPFTLPTEKTWNGLENYLTAIDKYELLSAVGWTDSGCKLPAPPLPLPHRRRGGQRRAHHPGRRANTPHSGRHPVGRGRRAGPAPPHGLGTLRRRARDSHQPLNRHPLSTRPPSKHGYVQNGTAGRSDKSADRNYGTADWKSCRPDRRIRDTGKTSFPD